MLTMLTMSSIMVIVVLEVVLLQQLKSKITFENRSLKNICI